MSRRREVSGGWGAASLSPTGDLWAVRGQGTAPNGKKTSFLGLQTTQSLPETGRTCMPHPHETAQSRAVSPPHTPRTGQAPLRPAEWGESPLRTHLRQVPPQTSEQDQVPAQEPPRPGQPPQFRAACSVPGNWLIWIFQDTDGLPVQELLGIAGS